LKFTTVRNCGKVAIEFFNIDTDGARVSRDFLKRLINNIVRRATEYYDTTGIPGDHIFSYREKQFHSVVCPSIADITGSYVIEHPLKRKPQGEEEYQGHVDYWIKYRKYSFLMELKHTFFALRRPNSPRANISKKFDRAMDQLKSIRMDMCRELNLNEGLIKIALEAIVFLEGSKNKLSIDSLKDLDFAELLKTLINNMKTNQRLDMQALWVLNSRLVEPYQYPDGTSEIFPAVAFIANISEMIE